MRQLLIDDFLLLRSPAYSYQDFSEQYLKQVLGTDFFRASLFFASKSLYTELRKKNFDYDLISPSARISLWKYLNRMCYRALPYGLFSSYSSAIWAEASQATLSFTDDDELMLLPDFTALLEYTAALNPEYFEELLYFTNNSMYQASPELRFISRVQSAQKKFAIVQLKVSTGLNKLLKYISRGRTKRQIIEFLQQEYGTDAPAEDYFRSLLSGQVIVSSLAPNVTGDSFSERCLKLLNEYPGIESDNLRSYHFLLKDEVELSRLNEHIRLLMAQKSENPCYSLYHRPVQGGLSRKLEQKVLALIHQLDRLSGDHQWDFMNDFKKEFRKKYDQQEVPLMLVLDPGSGIGYDNMASAFDAQDDDFIGGLRTKPERVAQAKWGAVEQMIFRKWNALRQSGSNKIIIKEQDLAALPESNQPLPPGLFVLFRNIDDEIWLDGIGGVSGIEINARFSISDPEMQDSLRKICEQEMSVNDDFIFAEIAYSPNDRISNINQRGHFYRYEIPVLTHIVRPEPYSIMLSDLMLSLRGNQFLLRSLKLNRYIIPRLSTAYNYKVSSIPVFRFLCDLQYQGLKSDLSFSLSALFPGMDFYPRLQLGTTVLSAATWIIRNEQLKKISAEEGPLNLDAAIPQRFRLLEGDNFLVFNQQDENDRMIFRKCIKNKEKVTLTEYISGKSADLKDQQGKAYDAQFVACAINQSKSYHLPQSYTVHYPNRKFKVKRSFLPGEEWLYVKLYAHYSLTDEILLKIVLPVVRKYKKDNPGFKWFFIRYLDPGYHLRLRFYGASISSYELLADLINKLQAWTKQGKVSDVVLDSYQRELEKYSASVIDDVESFFYRDTEMILFTFSISELSTVFKLSFALNTSLQLIHHFIVDKQERSDFLNTSLQHMSAEFNREKEVLRELDLKYRNFQQQLVENQRYLSLIQNRKPYRQYQLMMDTLLSKLSNWSVEARYHLLTNLVHMHINRIFEDTPREYEYLIYHFMKKHQAFLNYTTSDGF